MSGTGPRSGPAGATAPARRKARKPSERSERPALEGNENMTACFDRYDKQGLARTNRDETTITCGKY